MQCMNCKHSGANMKRCKKCGMTYCRSCANKGVGGYKKVAANKCPHCGVLNQAEPAK